jgi:superfamily II DNA/RNA helicase
MSFEDLNLPTGLIAALARQQITDPTPIQVAALPVLLEGKDAYLYAETGTGKTLAYLLPLFCRIDAALAATQVVIVAPTHELAIQIHRQSCDLAQNAGMALRSVLLIGGTAVDRQIDKLKAPGTGNACESARSWQRSISPAFAPFRSSRCCRCCSAWSSPTRAGYSSQRTARARFCSN